MNKPKNLIFDFDGTLADSLQLYLDILYRGRTSSPSPVTEEQLLRLKQTPLLRMVGQLDVPRFSRMHLLWARWRHLPKRIGEIEPFTDIPKVVSTLHKEGHRLFILSSNFEKNVQAFLRFHKLDKYFSGVYHTNVFIKKRGLVKLAVSEHLERQDTYYIANEPLDMRAAREAGMHGVAVLWSGQAPSAMSAEHPNATAKEPVDLLKLFKVD
jgi:phosphoglycolate phosphatase